MIIGNLFFNSIFNIKVLVVFMSMVVKKIFIFKINFVGGNKLQLIGNKIEDIKGIECVKSIFVIFVVQIFEVK